jgi:hypothetical protein
MTAKETKKKSETVATPAVIVDEQINTIIRINKTLEAISKKAESLEEYKFYKGTVNFATDGVHVKYYSSRSDKVGTLAELETQINAVYEEIKSRKPTKVKNLTNYGDDASVSSKGITVGCRTITFSKFNELADIVQDFQERQKAKAAEPKKEKKTATKKTAKKATKKTAKSAAKNLASNARGNIRFY